ncbi:MAG: hypothetical protein LBQ11_01975 [Candidatus Nomurabacteria bacterium]|jgi:hypothetical protein|nr:hypothetical protein [Candidatus Nomurabacteria bacterium]
MSIEYPGKPYNFDPSDENTWPETNPQDWTPENDPTFSHNIVDQDDESIEDYGENVDEEEK